MTPTQTILCLNSGSSSLKLDVYEMGAGEMLVAQGSVEGIGQGAARIAFSDAAGRRIADRELGRIGHVDAIEHTLAALAATDLPSIDAIGHRIVHGGPSRFAPELLTPALVADLAAHAAWAPLHIPPALRVIESVRALHPHLPQVACFDTAFHAAIPELARRFPLPRAFFDAGVRRYGFHGLSYEYVLGALGHHAHGKLVVAHLGNGASMAACLDGRPIDTTMGMTPLGGFMMGTRTGDMDPGVLLYLLRERGYDAASLEALLDRESGLLGVSGTTADMRTLLERRAAGDGACTQAVEMYCYHARKTIGSLAAALGGLDLLVFTAGIGEHAAPVRALVCDGLAHLGITLDPECNAAHAEVISTRDSWCEVRVVPTNEELTIARHTYALVFGGGAARNSPPRGSDAPGAAAPHRAGAARPDPPTRTGART